MEKKFNSQSVTGLVLLGVIMLVLSLYIIFYGAPYDTGVYTGLAVRFAKGEFPLVSVWGPFTISNWLLSPIYKLVGMFGNGYDYIVIILKAIGVVAQMITAMVFYMKTRAYNRSGAFKGAVAFAMFLPYYMFCFIFHYTLIYWITLLLVLVIMRAENHGYIRNGILLATIMMLQILIMPTCVLEYLVIVPVILKCMKEPKRTLGVFAIATGIWAIIGIIILYLNGGNILDIFNILTTDSTHKGLGIYYVKRFAVYAVIAVIVWIGHKLIELLKLKKYEMLIFSSLGLVATIGYFIVTRGDLAQLMRVSCFSIILLGEWCILFGKEHIKEELKKYYTLFIIWGITYALVVCVTSMTGAMITALGFIVPVIGFAALSEKDKWKEIAFTVILIIVFLPRISVSDGMQEALLSDCTQIIENGPLKGLHVEEYVANDYNYLWDVINRDVTDDDKLLLVGSRMMGFGYLMTNAEVCSSGVYDEYEDGYTSFSKYYEEYPEKIPNKIIIKDGFYNYNFKDASYEFATWAKENYHIIDSNELYYVFERN